MRTFCALIATVCFGLVAAELYFHAADHLWIPHSLTFLLSGIAMVFNYISEGYRR